MTGARTLMFLWLTMVMGLSASDPNNARLAVESAAARQRVAAQAVRSAAAAQWSSTMSAAAIAARQQLQSVSLQLRRSPVSAGMAALPSVPAGAPCPSMPGSEAHELVESTARQYGLSPDLLHSLVTAESGFRPCAVSPKGAMGLAQLMPATVEQFGVRDPFDPKENLDSAARFLRQLLARYGGNVALALAAYNAGPARVDEAGQVPAFPETLRYVNQILNSIEPKDLTGSAWNSDKDF
ncbi:MAG: lytic transglycosylase domain-containing protein [Bryobacteraceae bacterium]